MTREWLFHNKGLLNWWFTDTWGDSIRTGLKERLLFLRWVGTFLKTHKPKDNSLGINRVIPLGQGTTKPTFRATAWDENDYIHKYINWFYENVTISPARKTGEYAQASRFDAPIYEITVSLDYSPTDWARVFAGAGYGWALEVPLEWIFKTNLEALQSLPLTGETLVEEMEHAACDEVRTAWLKGNPMSENRFTEPIYPYQNVAVVGVEKSIAFSLSGIEEGEKEVTRFGEKDSRKEWTITFTPKTYYEGQPSISMEDFLNKSEVKP